MRSGSFTDYWIWDISHHMLEKEMPSWYEFASTSMNPLPQSYDRNYRDCVCLRMERGGGGRGGIIPNAAYVS